MTLEPTTAAADVDRVLEVIGRRGVLPVLRRLTHGPMRHNDLARNVDMDNKQLARILRQAESAGLVVRAVSSSRPVRVKYSLSAKAERLMDLVEQFDGECG